MKSFLRKNIIYGIYGLFVLLLSIYSFALVDPNLTLINHHFWEVFRNVMVQIGYYERALSWNMYLVLILGLFILHVYVVKNHKNIDALKISGVAALVLLLSYPFLSHDFFNYMFDARMLTYYGANPYTHKALDFPGDEWVRFMHWTHRSYPYGPSFLLFTLVPSFLGFGTLILNYIFFKASFIGMYILAVWALKKKSNEWAMFFASHPLIIIEGLVNGHNDLVAVSFAIIGIILLMKGSKRFGLSGLLFLFSGGIKYFSAPTLLLPKNSKAYAIALPLFLLTLAPIVYISLTGEIQSWYYLNLLIFIPYFYTYISQLHIFFLGLLLSYYPFIALGGWGKIAHTQLKHEIILWAIAAQCLYSGVLYLKKRKK